MKQTLYALLVGTVLSIPASALPVTFSTVGVFSGCTDVANQVSGCTSNGNTILFGSNLGGNQGVQLTFTGVASSSVNATTNASLGDIILTCLGGGTGCASVEIPAGLQLAIDVTQTAPTPGGPTGIPAGLITGAVSGTSTNGTITWPANNTINIGVVSYQILNNPLGLVPPSTNGGDTTVQGAIGAITDNSAVPEPATLGGAGLALLALGWMRRRRWAKPSTI